MKVGPKPIAIELRFWRNVDVREPSDCWEWQLTKGPTGYGRFKRNGIYVSSHRMAWILANGEVPENHIICHHCDNPGCCNPRHLYAGTKSTNAMDYYTRHRGEKKKYYLVNRKPWWVCAKTGKTYHSDEPRSSDDYRGRKIRAEL